MICLWVFVLEFTFDSAPQARVPSTCHRLGTKSSKCCQHILDEILENYPTNGNMENSAFSPSASKQNFTSRRKLFTIFVDISSKSRTYGSAMANIGRKLAS